MKNCQVFHPPRLTFFFCVCVQALKRAGIFDDTLIIFTSDNGGPTHGDENTQSNNYPMRGGKNTLFEGGTRVVGMLAGAGVNKTGGYFT